MRKCNYVKVETIKSKYGDDWSNLYIDGANFEAATLLNVKLPNQKNLFTKIKNKSLIDAIMPPKDYSMYDMKDVNIRGTVFKDGSVATWDSETFINIHDKNLNFAYLPEMDCSDMNFDGVDIRGTVFKENSKFSSDREVFQKVKDKNIAYTILPKGDYRYYNFKGVNMRHTDFGRESLLPEYENFLKDIEYKSNFELTKNMLRKIHLYNLDGIVLDLRIHKWYAEFLSQNQIDIIKNNYPTAIDKSIMLPEKVFGEEVNKGYEI